MAEKLVIVGAGVAGVNAATKLVDNGFPGKNITIIDMGKDPYRRPYSEVMTGFLGAGGWSDGKLTYHTAIGGHMSKSNNGKLDKVLADARRSNDRREEGYREQALKMYPHICGRCSREFTRKNLHELTVHHRDHNHDYNPADGSNWELLCMYCHDNEHQRQLEAEQGNTATDSNKGTDASFKPFADLKSLLEKE